MGTRADFYVKRDDKIKWLGSVHWDGYDVAEAEESDKCHIRYNVKQSKTEEEFTKHLDSYFSVRDDVRLPENGWPWPWEDSRTSDMAYVFDENKLRIFSWGSEIDVVKEEHGSGFDYEAVDGDDFQWPDMSDIANVTTAGFIVMSA